MNFVIIIFFLSLLAIGYMIGKKLFLVKKAGGMIEQVEAVLIAPDLDSVKHVATKKLKQYSYILLLIILRISVKSNHYIGRLWQDAKKWLNEKLQNENENEKVKEISKFLKSVSDYKKKIKNIKDRIIEEERLK